jgi:poly(3-hydroxybutyrate) depolymerase
MRHGIHRTLARGGVGIAAIAVVTLAVGGCSNGSAASSTPATAAAAASAASAQPLTKCSDISDVMTLLADAGKQLTRDKEAGAASGVQQDQYDRLKKQSATRIDELATMTSDPPELQQVAVLFSTVFSFGLENPASQGPFDSATQKFEEACGYALFG